MGSSGQGSWKTLSGQRPKDAWDERFLLAEHNRTAKAPRGSRRKTRRKINTFIKKYLCLLGNWKNSTYRGPGKGHVQRGTEKTIALHTGLILGSEDALLISKGLPPAQSQSSDLRGSCCFKCLIFNQRKFTVLIPSRYLALYFLLRPHLIFAGPVYHVLLYYVLKYIITVMYSNIRYYFIIVGQILFSQGSAINWFAQHWAARQLQKGNQNPGLRIPNAMFVPQPHPTGNSPTLLWLDCVGNAAFDSILFKERHRQRRESEMGKVREHCPMGSQIHDGSWGYVWSRVLDSLRQVTAFKGFLEHSPHSVRWQNMFTWEFGIISWNFGLGTCRKKKN